MQKKWDYNDALQREGAEQLKKQIDGSLKRDYPNSYIKKGYAAFKKQSAKNSHLSLEERFMLANKKLLQSDKKVADKKISAQALEDELEL